MAYFGVLGESSIKLPPGIGTWIETLIRGLESKGLGITGIF